MVSSLAIPYKAKIVLALLKKPNKTQTPKQRPLCYL